MTDTPVAHTYLAIPSSGDGAHHSDVHETGIDRVDFGTASVRVAIETRTEWAYFFLGCAILLPWNTLANGTPFFLSRLADSPLRPAFGSYLSSVYTLTKMVCQFYCAIGSKQSSPSRRIFASITAMIILVMFLWFTTFIRSTPSTLFSLFLFLTASLAVAAAYLSAAVYAQAALLGPSFLQAVLSGQAANAVVTSAVDVASSLISLWGLSPQYASMDVPMRTKGRGDQAEELAARIFFSVSAIFLGLTLVGYAWLTDHSLHGSPIGSLERRRAVEDVDERVRLLADNRGSSPTEADSHIYQIFKQNSSYMFSIAYSFTITLALFPAITIRVQPVNPGIHPMLFTAAHFLVLNIADLVGRRNYSSAYLTFWSAKKILVMSLLRTLFIPITLACNIPRPETTPSVFPIIHSDVYFMLVISALGYTQGALFTLAMLSVSSLEHNPRLKGRREDVQATGMLSGTLAIVGLALGSLCSFFVQALI